MTKRSAHMNLQFESVTPLLLRAFIHRRYAVPRGIFVSQSQSRNGDQRRKSPKKQTNRASALSPLSKEKPFEDLEECNFDCKGDLSGH